MMRYRRGESPDTVATLQDEATRGNGDAMVRLAEIAARTHDATGDAETERLLRSAVDIGHIEATHRLGVILWQRGETHRGEELVRRAALQGYGDAIDTMGWLCDQRRHHDAAEAWFAWSTDLRARVKHSPCPPPTTVAGDQ